MLLESVSLRTRVPIDRLETIAMSASKRYRVYTIPKRSGGEREISHPSRVLKALQRWITRNLINQAPVHHAATAYRKGAGIKLNASRHAGTKFTLRMDFNNFFPSFDASSIEKFIVQIAKEKNILLNERDLDFCIRILCRNGHLTIGAPSSPALTNAMMFDFDAYVENFAVSRDMVYTRYADDIFLSSYVGDVLPSAEKAIAEIVSRSDRPKLTLNDRKTLHLSRAGHRSVTGLVLTPNGHVSLGRDRKREIRSMVFEALNSRLNPVDRGRLAGLIAYANDVEPDFVAALSLKFSIDVMSWAKTI